MLLCPVFRDDDRVLQARGIGFDGCLALRVSGSRAGWGWFLGIDRFGTDFFQKYENRFDA